MTSSTYTTSSIFGDVQLQLPEFNPEIQIDKELIAPFIERALRQNHIQYFVMAGSELFTNMLSDLDLDRCGLARMICEGFCKHCYLNDELSDEEKHHEIIDPAHDVVDRLLELGVFTMDEDEHIRMGDPSLYDFECPCCKEKRLQAA